MINEQDLEFDLQRFADEGDQDTGSQATVDPVVDQKKDPVVDQKDTAKDEGKKVEDKNTSTDENLDKIINEKFDLFKTNYENKIKDLEKQRRSLDQKVTEQRKKIESYEKREMTEEQLKELERQDRIKGWQELYVAQASVKYNLNKDDDDMNFDDFLYSNEEDPDKMKEEIFEKGRMLREYLDKVIKIGIERGVAERIAQGFKPKSSSESNNAEDLESMSRDEISKKMNEVMKMPPSPEKDAILAKMMAEQTRRLSQ